MAHVDINSTGQKYKTIYADPPWWERGGGKIKRGADRHYPLMKTKDIMAIPVQRLIHPDGCHLYLWATNNHLQDAFKVIKAWGFEYVTMITWQKDKVGLGQYYRGNTEHCLFATTKKRLPYKLSPEGKRCQGVTGFTAERTIHSRKPEEMRRMIETVSYGSRLEMFARERVPGWDCWGNEV
jgi:N6-adenosine-specific RNA methylase IME4